jgi:hypothetical protein
VADPADYHARWKRNAALADVIATSLPEGADWEIVVRFYAMLHLVEGVMRTKEARFHSSRHEQRTKALRQSPELRNALAPYRDLEDLSQSVRYDPKFVAREQDFANAKMWASTVESCAGGRLTRALPAPLPAVPTDK